MDAVCAGWRQRAEAPALARLGVVLPEMVSALVVGVGAEYEALAGGDGRAVSLAAQRAVQPAGVAFMRGAWQLQGHTMVPAPGERPCCENCGRRLKLVSACRLRQLVGRCGRYALGRPYFTCEDCGGGCAPADAVWGLAPGLLDPDLMEVVAGDGVRDSFAEAAGSVWRHLQVQVDDNETQRTTEAMGLVALRRVEERADSGTCHLADDPGSDILLLELDGGRADAGGEWRETKVAAAGPLGPDEEVDPETGRTRLCTGPLLYAADIATAERFFDRQVRQLAEDAGLFHPRVRSVVLLSDGGEWIEARWPSLGLPDRVAVFDILDVRHFEQHVWTAAKASWGENSAKTKAWATKEIDAVRTLGPKPLLEDLAHLRPRRAAGREEMRKLRGYVERNAHRLRYPEFVAHHLPIASGAIEGGVRTVNNERLKASGMHWSVPGARAVLALRAIALSPPQSWARFWCARPHLARPASTELPGWKKKAA